jgi:putative ABC transport system permease protein
MLKHELLLIIRNLKKTRIVSSISILGLTVGFTFVILGVRYVYTEKTFDRFHKNHRSIYRVEKDSPEHGYSCYSPNIMYSWLKDNIPEVKKATRIINDGHSGMMRNVVYNSIKYNISKPLIVDEDFFSIFSFRILSGEVESFGRDKYSLALNESLAKKIFGSEDPVGKTMGYKGEIFTVKAVMEEPPPNSSIKFDVLLPIANIPDYANDMNWTNSTLQIFILAADNIPHKELQEKIHLGVTSALKPLGIFETVNPWQNKLNPMRDIYYSPFTGENICIHGNIKLTFLLLSVAVIVLVIAMINYINASMVKASERIKEIGIRKVSGASVSDNVRMLIYESSFPCLIAVILALLCGSLLEPVIHPLLNVPLVALDPLHSILLIAGGLILGALTSLYPALKISYSSITDSLKEKSKRGRSAFFFRSSLSVIQFAASIALIISLFAIHKQLDYMLKQSGTNFDENLVLYMPLSDRTATKNPKIYTIQESLKSLAEVAETSSCLHLPGDERYSGLGISFQYKGEEKTGIQVNHNMVDIKYPEVMGYEIVYGRSFNPEIKSDYGSYLVNETFKKMYNIENLSDATLNDSPIIGVIKDIHFNSLHKKIEPMAIRYFDSYQSRIVIRLSSSNITSLSEVVEKIRKTVDAIDNTAIADVHFLDQHIAALYEKEEKISKILFLLASFSILISCMGLFSMSLFAAKSRTKEIGIRRVIGAKVSEIMVLLNRDFIKWVAIAFVIACPVSWYAINRWLENFAYKTALSWWIFALAGVIALSIALFTVSWQTWRAASRNPVEALRYE